MTGSDESARGLLETKIDDESAQELADLASIWADLLLVQMCLHHRKSLTGKAMEQIFVKRALWEQAVVAYARCFNTGRGRPLPHQLREQIGEDSLQVHDEIIRWRDKHVAHRVDQQLQRTHVSLTYPGGQNRAQSVRVRVEQPTGPEDERLADALLTLAERLKDRLWERWFPALETQILDLYEDNAALRARASVFGRSSRRNTYLATLNPSTRGGGLPS